MIRSGISRTLAAAAVVLALSGIAAGCGSSGEPERPRVENAPDRFGRVSALEQKVADLRKTKTRLRERRNASARASSRASEGADAGALVEGLSGQSGVALAGPGGGGPELTAGTLGTGAAWSTIKVPIIERVLEDAGGPGNLDATARGWIDAAITRSDNDAAAALFARLESAHGGLAGASEAVGGMLRAAGDSSTVVSTRGRDGFSTYGQTEWSLAEQNRYMAALAGGCVSDPASRDYILGRMASVGGSDVYGLGSTGLPARWKGGWGPGPGGRYLVRQMGVLDAAGGPVVVAMAAVPDDGSFESGQTMLNEIAARIAARFARKSPPARPC